MRLLLQTERPRKPFRAPYRSGPAVLSRYRAGIFGIVRGWCAPGPLQAAVPGSARFGAGMGVEPLKADDDTDARPDCLDVRIPSRPLQAVVRHVDPLERGECVNARANAHEHAA